MYILGIETSCDETACAIVKNGTEVISNIIASSVEMHAKTGGIIPEQAARKQAESMIPVIEEALNTSNLKVQDISAIAVTIGPGLIGSLLVGIETAKTLSLVWNKPIIPVNHLVAHIYANFIENENSITKIPEFPALALVVSGGHTDLVLIKGHSKIEWIGGTRDDAAGEAFDKTARLLNLPYPGGPSISKASEEYLKTSAAGNIKLDLFPRPLWSEDNFDWSFSGLKTAVLKATKEIGNLKNETPSLAANIQEAIVDSLVNKTIKAIKKYKPKSFLLAGGVSANKRLRDKFTQEIDKYCPGTHIFFPEPKYCTDNAASIASCAFFNNFPVPWERIEANPELAIVN